MLSVLKIQNLALVDSLTWELAPGLICVTGETGAGKSVIVGAVKLVLGERADRGLIRSGESACTVEALFDLADPSAINQSLADAGLDPCDEGELVVRRVIVASGTGNKQFINGSPVTLATLRSLGHHLVDLHGPHDHQSLLARERQLAMLDAYAGCAKQRDAYSESYAIWRRTQSELTDLANSERASAQELDLLRFQTLEIEEADLKPGEEDEIEARYKVASNAQKLVEEAAAALNVVKEIGNPMADLQRHLAVLARTDPSVESFAAGAETAALEIAELEASLTDYAAGLEIDPAEATALESRLDLIHTLKRKYGSSVEEVIAHYEEASTKLARTENRAGELERLEKESAAALTKLRKNGVALSKSRKKAAPKLASEVSSHLSELGFKRATFEIALEALDETSPASDGLEAADFLFAPNPGEPMKPLRQTASSGEMSRTMLAVKSALVKEDNIPLLIFDEIDANVGGEIAAAVGRKMAELGRGHQVVSITHLPQVAALAAGHYVVHKDFTDDRTRSHVEEVVGADRVSEIARMLGGDTVSARAHATALMGEPESETISSDQAAKPPKKASPRTSRNGVCKASGKASSPRAKRTVA